MIAPRKLSGLSTLILLCGLQSCARPTEQAFRGTLLCAATPGSPPSMLMPMTVYVDGPELTYSQQLRHVNGASMALAEAGTGKTIGAYMMLRGGATMPGLHETGLYRAVEQAGGLLVEGSQLWIKYLKGVEFRWPCRGILQKAS